MGAGSRRGAQAGGGEGSERSMGTEHPFRKMKELLEMDGGDVYATM